MPMPPRFFRFFRICLKERKPSRLCFALSVTHAVEAKHDMFHDTHIVHYQEMMNRYYEVTCVTLVMATPTAPSLFCFASSTVSAVFGF